MVPKTNTERVGHLNGISVGSAVFAQHIQSCD